jgi:hypothetical protein
VNIFNVVRTSLFSLALLAGVASTARAWTLQPGCLRAIAGKGANNRVLGIGCSDVAGGGQVTISTEGAFWISDTAGKIYTLNASGNDWALFSNMNKCSPETGTIKVDSADFWDTKIAINNGSNLYAITQEIPSPSGYSVRRFGGSCWQSIAAGGTSRDISMANFGASQGVFVRSGSNSTTYRWFGTTWEFLGFGTAVSVTRDYYILGTDAPSNKVYQWTQASGTYVFIENGPGAVTPKQIFRTSQANLYVIDSNNQVWTKLSTF